MPDSCPFLFVYGTLRRDFDHAMARFLAEHAYYRGEARVAGRLYDLGSYPGMTEAASEGEWVLGDLFELTVIEATLAILDRYEECPLPGEAAQFERERVVAVRDGGEQLVAWTYWYRGVVTEEQRIPSGNYCSAFRKEGGG